MKKLVCAILVSLLFLYACKGSGEEDLVTNSSGQNQSQSNNTFACISGEIYLYNTGNTVGGAWLQFLDYNTDGIVYSAILNDDGYYTTSKIFKEGVYYPRIIKVDNVDTLYNFNGKSDRIISITLQDNCTQVDWMIVKEPSTLWIASLNNPNERKDTLNFGETSNIENFQIVNKGGVRFTWQSHFDDAAKNYTWLKALKITNGSNTLKQNQSAVISVEIDRTQVTKDEKIKFSITSDEGGNREIWIKVLK